MSPGSAPAMATGPVMMWPPARGRPEAWIAASAGGIVMPEPAGGMTSGAPETHSRTTVSPEFTVSSGGYAASTVPQRTVCGEAAIRCVAISEIPGCRRLIVRTRTLARTDDGGNPAAWRHVALGPAPSVRAGGRRGHRHPIPTGSGAGQRNLGVIPTRILNDRRTAVPRDRHGPARPNRRHFVGAGGPVEPGHDGQTESPSLSSLV